jgi:hypothetical protein
VARGRKRAEGASRTYLHKPNLLINLAKTHELVHWEGVSMFKPRHSCHQELEQR